MFDQIRTEIRKTDHYKEERENLVDIKLFYQLPNQALISTEILSNDSNAKSLLDEIKTHTENYPSGKIVFEKKKKDPVDERGYELKGLKLIVHMYDPERTDLSKTISSTEDTRERTHYKISPKSFADLQEIAVNYDTERTMIDETKIGANTV